MSIEIYVIDGNIKFIITNSFNGEIDLNIGNKIFSTKGKNRGHGLLLVKEIINNNNKIFIQKRKISKDLYIQTLLIKEK